MLVPEAISNPELRQIFQDWKDNVCKGHSCNSGCPNFVTLGIHTFPCHINTEEMRMMLPTDPKHTAQKFK